MKKYIIVSIILSALILLSVTVYTCENYTRTNNKQIPFYVSWIIHIHQPYYNENGSLVELLNSNNCPEWLSSVWSTRADIYKYYIPWVALNMTGDEALQVDITGTLIDQLNELEDKKWNNCLYCGWKNYWLRAVDSKTSFGYPRLRILGAGYYHPIFPLIIRSGFEKDFFEQVNRHRELIRSNFNVEVDKGFFLIEESFSPEIIPLIKELGFEWTVVDSEQLLRATEGYNSQYEPKPNLYDIRNPNPKDWDWGISPQLVFRPHVIEYNGSEIVVFIRYRHMSQAEMSGTNIDYLINQIKHFQQYNTDPKRPFIMVIVHDGENGFPYQEWGGSHGYQYYVNYLIEFLNRIHNDPSLSFIKVIGLTEYLEKVYDPRKDNDYRYSKVWIEPGSWETMGTWGDPDFTQWNYPDINGPDQARWSYYIKAVNYYLTAENIVRGSPAYNEILDQALKWILVGETSCYYYWDGNNWWDVKALVSFNNAISIAKQVIRENNGVDNIPPTIRWSWRSPYNPGTHVDIYVQIFDLSGVSEIKAYIYKDNSYIGEAIITPLNINNFYKISFNIEEQGIYIIKIYAVDAKGNSILYDLVRPFYASLTPHVPPTTSIFQMDGLLDESMLVYNNTSNQYIHELWVSWKENYLYVATNPIPSNVDLFIFLSSNPWESMIRAPWIKKGLVANYNLYLGVEGNNNWSGWFKQGDQLISEDCGSTVGLVIEGYIDIVKYIGCIEQIYVAVAVYETPDHGKLVESLININGDLNIDPEEYIVINISMINISTPIMTSIETNTSSSIVDTETSTLNTLPIKSLVSNQSRYPAKNTSNYTRGSMNTYLTSTISGSRSSTSSLTNTLIDRTEKEREEDIYVVISIILILIMTLAVLSHMMFRRSAQ
ncbi:MAG: hypothetical protein B6U89_06205 [Desulfurococcales archaeon ex4484_58]|nr:MAG: hypothetical protein B6U89_06205 [Desulfurococcales archaeon ex4484_58]